jgi:electron transport complex protein RnfC
VKLPTFKKGVFPSEYKELTAKLTVAVLPLPEEVYIPLQQHAGAACEPTVQAGDEVKTGQVIGESAELISSPVHASITGKIKAVSSFQHPMGARVPMIHITRTSEDEWLKMPVADDWQTKTREELIKPVRDAGIVGLGGAAFPTHVKLSPPATKKVDSFILNGCECEPYLTADHRAMIEYTDELLQGMKIIMTILGVEQGYIGIENNKSDAIALLKQRVAANGYDYNINVVPLQVKYPQGAEKMLIEAILHREVPVRGLPMDVGVVVNNVGTAIAVSQAVTQGKPLVERIVTVTGDGIATPKNVLVRLGTPFKHLIEYCGGLQSETTQVFMGGPMMGMSQYTLEVPVVKATSGIVCVADPGFTQSDTFPCIRCGACVTVCPVNLLPTRIARLAEISNWEAADEWGIMNCLECGSCSHECPSHIPLVQWIRVGKLQITQLNRKKAA